MLSDATHLPPHLRKKARIILDDGTEFEGRVFAAGGERYAEIIFNTGMVGYQEILTDPSYTGQAVVMTYPLIGNYGISAEDFESRKIFLEAFIIREYIPYPSNWRASKTLKSFLEHSGILGIDQVDTRALTKHLREKGASKAVLTVFDNPVEEYVEKLRTTNVIERFNVAKYASCDATYEWPKPSNPQFKVAVIDCGIKYNILNCLQKNNCASTIYTSQVHVEEILDKGYDGVFLSNGPGDPEPLHNITRMVGQLLGKIPIFGICLGHQILGQALGLKIFKLKYGHHGINHPIRNLQTGKIEIASHNHNFAIDPASLNENVEVTHINLNDNTIAGIRHKSLAAFSVQYHPEAAPGPQDSLYLFEQFCRLMKEFRQKKVVVQPRPDRAINLLVRQSLTETNQEDGKIIEQVLELINSLNKKPFNLHLLAGNKALSSNDLEDIMHHDSEKSFDPRRFRSTRLSLLQKADGLVVIRTARSESTAFEISYNIYGGRRVPVFFAVSEKAPIQTTLLRNLEDQVDVYYSMFKRPEELLIPLQNFIYELEAKKNQAPRYNFH